MPLLAHGSANGIGTTPRNNARPKHGGILTRPLRRFAATHDKNSMHSRIPSSGGGNSFGPHCTCIVVADVERRRRNLATPETLVSARQF